MKRFRSTGMLVIVLGLTACNGGGAGGEDAVLRAWATTVDDHLDALNNWNQNTVLPGLLLLCDLERNVFDNYHPPPPPASNKAPNPVPRRFCKTVGPVDPVPPPPPPKDWDD